MKTFFLPYKLFLVLHAGKKSSNYFPGWQKHNWLISWEKGEQKNSWLGVTGSMAQILAGKSIL